MIDRVSSNQPLLASAAVAVVSSVVLAIFLNRMGWNGTIKTYPVAMYSWMSVGGVSFVCLCVASCLKSKKRPIVENMVQEVVLAAPANSIETQVEKLLEKPVQKPGNYISILEGLGLPLPVAYMVLDFSAFPIENIFLKLKRGIPLSIKDSHYSSIKAALILCVEGGLTTEHLFGTHRARFAYFEARRLVEALPDEVMYQTSICRIVSLLLHSTLDGEIIDMDSINVPWRKVGVERRVEVAVMRAGDAEAGFHFFSRLESFRWANIFHNPSHFLSEHSAILFLENLFMAKEGSHYINPFLAVQQGYALFLEKVLQNKSRNICSMDRADLWTHFFTAVTDTTNFYSRPGGDYVRTAITLIRYQIPYNIAGYNGITAKAEAHVRRFGSNDLKRVFEILNEIGNPFLGTLTDEELVTFNARLIQEGIMA